MVTKQEHWAGKHPLTLYSFPELNPHRLLVIVHTHLDMHTHTQTLSHAQNSHNQLLAIMVEDSLSQTTPSSSPSIPIVLTVIMVVYCREIQCVFASVHVCVLLYCSVI